MNIYGTLYLTLIPRKRPVFTSILYNPKVYRDTAGTPKVTSYSKDFTKSVLYSENATPANVYKSSRGYAGALVWGSICNQGTYAKNANCPIDQKGNFKITNVKPGGVAIDKFKIYAAPTICSFDDDISETASKCSDTDLDNAALNTSKVYNILSFEAIIYTSEVTYDSTSILPSYTLSGSDLTLTMYYFTKCVGDCPTIMTSTSNYHTLLVKQPGTPADELFTCTFHYKYLCNDNVTILKVANLRLEVENPVSTKYPTIINGDLIKKVKLQFDQETAQLIATVRIWVDFGASPAPPDYNNYFTQSFKFIINDGGNLHLYSRLYGFKVNTSDTAAIQSGQKKVYKNYTNKIYTLAFDKYITMLATEIKGTAVQRKFTEPVLKTNTVVLTNYMVNPNTLTENEFFDIVYIFVDHTAYTDNTAIDYQFEIKNNRYSDLTTLYPLTMGIRLTTTNTDTIQTSFTNLDASIQPLVDVGIVLKSPLLTSNTDVCAATPTSYWCTFSGDFIWTNIWNKYLDSIIDLESTKYPKRGLRYYYFGYGNDVGVGGTRYTVLDKKTGQLTTIADAYNAGGNVKILL